MLNETSATTYRQAPTVEHSFGKVNWQKGWALCNVLDGSRLLSPDARFGQLVLCDAKVKEVVRASFALRTRTAEAETFLFVAQAEIAEPVTSGGGPHPVQIRVLVKDRRAAQEERWVTLDAVTVLAAARDHVEAIDVPAGR